MAFTTLLLAANLLGIYGGVSGVRTVNEFRTFQDTLPPAAQSQYISLSTAEQIQIFNAARNTGASPAAIEFYLDEVGRPGSPLSELPLADALRVSTLAEQAGRHSFLLDYVSRGVSVWRNRRRNSIFL